jgi:hypothetical protein
MPVTKYRDLDAASRDLWRDPTDPSLLRRSANLLQLAHRLTAPLPMPRGVTRYRSIEEADDDRRRWERERVERLRERREL